jgi:hypothetical protein
MKYINLSINNLFIQLTQLKKLTIIMFRLLGLFHFSYYSNVPTITN